MGDRRRTSRSAGVEMAGQAVLDLLKDGSPVDEDDLRARLGARLHRVPRIQEIVDATTDLHRLTDGRIVAIPALLRDVGLCVTPSPAGVLHMSEVAVLARRWAAWRTVPVRIDGGDPDTVLQTTVDRRRGWRISELATPDGETGDDGADGPPRVWIATARPEHLHLRPGDADPQAQQVVNRIARRTADPLPDARAPLELHLAIVVQMRRTLQSRPVSLRSVRRIAGQQRYRAAGPADQARAA